MSGEREYIMAFTMQSDGRITLEFDTLGKSAVREEIVRCKDCDHRRRSWNGRNPNFASHYFCAYTGGHEVKPDGFCYRGVRRDA